MSSLKKAVKSAQRKYRERSQPASRQHLGLLEKKKDYKIRAENRHRKERTLKALKRKALDRNPDEFYFNMVRTKKVDGVHQLREEAEPQFTEDQIKLMHSQDVRYVNMKRATEQKKIERLKSTLHLLDSEDKPKNTHIVYVDTKKEVEEFDAAKYFNTHSSLLSRVYNRPTMEKLETAQFETYLDKDAIAVLMAEKEQKYKELMKRIQREKELSVIAQKMELQKHLMDKKAKKVKVCEERKTAAAQYRWCFQRKR